MVCTLPCQMCVGTSWRRLLSKMNSCNSPRSHVDLPLAVSQVLPGNVSERIMKEAAAQQDELRAEALVASGGLREVRPHS